MGITFEVASFGGSLILLAFANTCEILSLLSKDRYFRGVVTLGTLRYVEADYDPARFAD